MDGSVRLREYVQNHMLGPLHSVRALRRIVLPALKRFSPGDITIRHHWTGDPLVLDAFRHKGYWYHGKQRERQTMLLFAELVGRGDTVIEIGGHIGYVTLHFAHLVGPGGRVVVFEPGANNLAYMKRNIAGKPWVSLVEQAVTNHDGSAQFHVENLTGQNNSLLEHYAPWQENQARAFVAGVEASTVTVACTTLDGFLRTTAPLSPSLIKIDVEGAELAVLQGMAEVLSVLQVALMVEITEHASEVLALLDAAGYRVFGDARQPIRSSDTVRGNVFCIKRGDRRLELFEVRREH